MVRPLFRAEAVFRVGFFIARPWVRLPGTEIKVSVMKVINSLKSAKTRHRDCRVVRRKGRVYVINKTNPRFKARQG